MLGWSSARLADRAAVSRATVGTFERAEQQPIPATVVAIRRALEAAGIEFLDDPDAPGLRLRKAAATGLINHPAGRAAGGGRGVDAPRTARRKLA